MRKGRREHGGRKVSQKNTRKRWEEKESEMRLLLEKNQEHSSVLLPFWMYTTFAYQQKHLLLILSSVTSANWLISNISTEAGCQRLTSSLNWTNLTSHTLTLASRLQARCDSLKLEFNAGGELVWTRQGMGTCLAGGGVQRSIAQIGFVMMREHFDCHLQVFICHHCSVWQWDGLASGTSVLGHLNHKSKKDENRAVTNVRFHWLILTECPYVKGVICAYMCVCVCLHVCLQKSMLGARGTLWMLLVWKQISCWQNADRIKYGATPLPSVFVLTLLAWD